MTTISISPVDWDALRRAWDEACREPSAGQTAREDSQSAGPRTARCGAASRLWLSNKKLEAQALGKSADARRHQGPRWVGAGQGARAARQALCCRPQSLRAGSDRRAGEDRNGGVNVCRRKTRNAFRKRSPRNWRRKAADTPRCGVSAHRRCAARGQLWASLPSQAPAYSPKQLSGLA